MKAGYGVEFRFDMARHNRKVLYVDSKRMRYNGGNFMQKRDGWHAFSVVTMRCSNNLTDVRYYVLMLLMLELVDHHSE